MQRRKTKSYRALLRTEALERAALRARRGPAQQLSELDRRLGLGEGAQKERARLRALLNRRAA